MTPRLLVVTVILASAAAFSVPPLTTSHPVPSQQRCAGLRLRRDAKLSSAFCVWDSKYASRNGALSTQATAWAKKPPAEALSMMKKGIPYVDIRTKNEFAGGHPEGALHIAAFKDSFLGIPVPAIQDFMDRMEKEFPDKDSQLVVGCASGKRSTMVCEALSKAGYSKITENESGFMGWSAAGLPVAVE